MNGNYLYNLSPITWSDPVLNTMASDGGSGLIGGGTITADLYFTLNSNDVGFGWPSTENITINFPLIVYSDGGNTWTGRIPCCDQYGLGYLYNVTTYFDGTTYNLPYSFGSVTQIIYAYNSFTCLVNKINDPFSLVSYMHSGQPALSDVLAEGNASGICNIPEADATSSTSTWKWSQLTCSTPSGFSASYNDIIVANNTLFMAAAINTTAFEL